MNLAIVSFSATDKLCWVIVSCFSYKENLWTTYVMRMFINTMMKDMRMERVTIFAEEVVREEF
jgi:hypothetical protein